MASLEKMTAALQHFEDRLNPARPEDGPYSPRITGYGEISTVFTFSEKPLKGYAFKRMAVFSNRSEITEYRKIFEEYHRLLQSCAVSTPDSASVTVKRGNNPVLYLKQPLIEPPALVQNYLKTGPEAGILKVLNAVLDRIFTVHRRNSEQPEKFQIGLDAQLSNWAFKKNAREFQPNDGLLYIDTSTPLYRLNSIEQINPEIFLRITPVFLRGIIRRFFLDEVVNRYYDSREQIIDLVANLNKEQRRDLIRPVLETANRRLEEVSLPAITLREIRKYYRHDAFIWRFFLISRRLERFMRTKFLREDYSSILPGRIRR